MEEKIMFSEKKSTPKILIVLVIAVIGGLIGSLFTYVALDKKIENLTGTNSNGTTKWDK